MNNKLPSTDPGLLAVHALMNRLQGKHSLIEEMPGGASTRRFFRIQRENDRAVAMYIPAPSQEIAKARQASGGEPFIKVASLLRKAQIRVPDTYENCEEHNILLVEDLGENTLAHYLEQYPDTRLELYRIAVRKLARAQDSLKDLPDNCIITQRAFDEDLLRWEVDHFYDWALKARGIHLNEVDADVFSRSAHYLATTIASWKRGFVHRDYQSRNLMVEKKEGNHDLVWIDFQDAMMGPRAYDLVALLTDSYQTFSREFIEERLDDYCEALGIEDQRERLGFEFDFITVQRKLKDAGRFIFIDRINKNPHFLQYVDSTIARAQEALSRVKNEGPLGELDALLRRVLT